MVRHPRGPGSAVRAVERWLGYLRLWHELQDVQLSDGSDTVTWKWTPSGMFSSRTTYMAFFFG
jgi:hypothetical protein